MNLQFIKYFTVLSEVGNFTQAAQRVHVVQSSFSAGIKKLEEQLNCKLFHRDNRNVVLTEEGKKLLPRAKQMLAIWHTMEHEFSSEQSTPLTLGIPSEIDFAAIIPMMKVFQERFPRHKIKMVEKSEEELMRLLRSKMIDGFFSKSQFQANDFSLENKLIREDRLVVATPSNHPLAIKGSLELRHLDGQSIIERLNCSLYDEMGKALKEHNVTPNFVFQAKGDDMAKALVASGIGLSLVPQPDIPYNGIAFLPISDAKFVRKIFFVWGTDQESKSLQDFLEI